MTFIDADGAPQTVDPGDYVLDAFSEPGRLLPVDKWPLADSRPGAVTVVYTAGYASAAAVPAPIKHWMLLALTDMHELRQRSGDKPAVPHEFADSLLAEYRMLGI